MPILRILPSKQVKKVGPFVFMDQGGPAEVPNTPQYSISEHPHAGLATFTYLLAGRGYHRDSAGNAASIRAGDIALMTAGSGVTHEERSDPNDPSRLLQMYFIQMWIALPDDREDMLPAFELHRQKQLPHIKASFGDVRVLIGNAWGVTAPTSCYTETMLADLWVHPKQKTRIRSTAIERAIYLIEGSANVDGNSIDPHTLSILKTGGEPAISTKDGCRVIVFGGAPFPSKRIVHGNFVASSMEKIQYWTSEYRSGRFPSIK